MTSISKTSLQDQVANFPEVPGVYIMKDAAGAILYIGKAVNLKLRVRSYFAQRHDGRAQIPVMMRKLESVEAVVTANETEALLLEAELVRKHLPKYNVLLRDDKRFPYLKITGDENFPRLIVTRKIDAADNRGKQHIKIFGPYTDVTLMRRVADFARRVFKIRACKKKLPLKKSARPCINQSMKQCGGMCAYTAGDEKYPRVVDEYQRGVNDLIMFLRGRHRDLVADFENRMAAASAELRFEDAAVYRNQIRLIKSLSRLRRPDLKVRNAEQNARLFLSKTAPVAAVANSITELQTALNLPILPRVIEAFDISNLGGSFTVAGMAQFVDGRPNKSAYRKYKIKTVEGQNDFAMMMEVVHRRLRRLSDEDKTFPDLLLIDGGKGQLNAAIAALSQFENPPQIISLAKKEELLFSPMSDDPVALPSTHPARKLVERIRDEVHRFAVTYHRKLRGKQFARSSLEDIEGVGKTKAAQLLKHFGSMKRLKDAATEEIAAVRGFSKESAERLKERLQDGAAT